MRMALLSDIHGNPIALEAVLADSQACGGVDEYWVLGDLAAGGYDPAGTLERLVELPNVRFVRGNGDRALVVGEPGPSLTGLRADPSQAVRQLEVAVLFAWSHGHVAAGGWLPWLAQLPLEQRCTLPDGTRLLAAHAAPGSDGSDGRGRTITPAHTDEQLRALLARCEAELVCVGHTHWPLDRSVDGVRVVNVGSVSNPWAPDLRASYVLLEAGADGYQVEHRRVAYDVAAVLEALRRSGHPTGALLGEHFRGERRPPWFQA